MDFCVVGGWESGQELAASQLMLMNAWICFRTSISFEGNNPLLQIRSFGGNRGKCNRTLDSTEPLFSSVLMRQDLRVADSSYLSWNEAYEHSLSLSSPLFLVPIYEGKPNGRHFFADIFIKRWFCSKKSCRICGMLSASVIVTVRMCTYTKTSFIYARMSSIYTCTYVYTYTVLMLHVCE